MSEPLDFTLDPQATLERAYPRWRVWEAEETGEWWAAVKVNLTRVEVAAGCESYRAAATPGELAQLLDAEDRKVGVERAPVRVAAWGLTPAHVGVAVDEMGLRPTRPSWSIAVFESKTGLPCPLNLDDKALIAAQAGDGWAYAVYPAAVDG